MAQHSTEELSRYTALEHTLKYYSFDAARDALAEACGPGVSNTSMILVHIPLNHEPLLSVAAARDKDAVQMCRLLVEQYKVDPNSMELMRKQTALFAAAANGNRSACQYLLGARCDPSLKDGDGRTPIFEAVAACGAREEKA